MIDQDITRLSRLTSIITTLMSRSAIPAQDILKKFNISKRTFYRDMNALQDAGVPITFEPNKGYTIAHWYKLPPMMFTREESMAFMTAEKFMETLADKSTAASYHSASQKIKTILNYADKNFIENMENSIAVLHHPYLPNKTEDLKYLNDIMTSVNEKKIIHIVYHSVNGFDKTERDIESIGIYYTTSRWYLIAYCHSKKEYRNFRVDRIASFSKTQKPFSKTHPSLHQYLQTLPKEDALQEVVIKMKKSDVAKLGDQKYYMGFVDEQQIGEDVIMTFMVASLDSFAKAYYIYGEDVDIISPLDLKDLIVQIGQNIIEKIKSSK